ncbi:MAG: ester cyclase [Syntrophorhabdales bacterium]|jgi:predicted ester cyclase
MSTEQNKATLRRTYEEVLNKGNFAVLNECMAPNYVAHGPGGLELKGPEAFGQYIATFRTAFPDLRVTVENMVAEGDYVAHRFSFIGMHRGDFGGIAPTGKRVTVTCNVVSRFTAGKEVEAWEEFDTLGFMQQLGVIPPMNQPGK